MATPLLGSVGKRKSMLGFNGVNISTILIPFDTEATEEGIRYIRHGAQLAKVFHAKIVLLHVVDPRAAAVEDGETNPKKDLEKATRRAKQIMEASQVAHNVVVTNGTPAEKIVGHACDLIMMSSHSQKGAEFQSLGSVAGQVLRESIVPVLILRAPYDPSIDPPISNSASLAPMNDDGTVSINGAASDRRQSRVSPAIHSTSGMALPSCEYRRILIAYDGTTLADNAILRVAPFARIMKSEVTIVYVLDEELYPEESVRRKQYENAEIFLKRGKTIAEQEGITNTKVQLESIQRLPAEHLVTLATTKGYDMIVIGTHGRSGLDRMLLGSVAERLLKTVCKPILVVGSKNISKDHGTSLNVAYGALPISVVSK
eukprot:TRINITY_DN7399_c0_g1_i1.p1 TRINITY_DN7399_c0_g1~~TRINITY_DN7399_c0_g1_i1.p1  ORF type:complete len:372 (+),score=85.76 TRINITY_DN7399_c0_g1_i1:75-1190(+)